jgi:hypothetical protein
MGERNLKNREALMTAPYQKVLSDGQFKTLKRYMVAAATAYAFIMIGVLTVIFTSDASDDTTSGYGVASHPSRTTDGHNKAIEQNAPAAAVRALPERDELKDDVRLPAGASWAVPSAQAARVPIPEVDELGETPMWPGDAASSIAARARSAAAPQGEALAENAWDFEKPETIPGFGAIVEHDTTPDGQRLTARRDPVTNR